MIMWLGIAHATVGIFSWLYVLHDMPLWRPIFIMYPPTTLTFVRIHPGSQQ